jgi:uncharacterized protein
MASNVFLDTAYAIALISPRDDFHEQAQSLSIQLEQSRNLVVTTRAVLVEIGNALSKRQFRSVAVQLLDMIEADPTIEIIPLSEELYKQAVILYSARPDKEWGLVDCISFVVMQERGIVDALTSDEHFQQAGFRVLLRIDSRTGQ